MSAGRLLELTVTDLALIDRLRLSFGAGLNVLTGETGAGKSLVIDALGLVIGQRADTGSIRHGAEVSRVEALFDRIPEPLIVVREVAQGGRSTARLDDVATTASRLGDEVGPLVEIHGQHDQQRLLDERWQRDLLEHEVTEIADANLRPGEADELRGRLDAAQHGEAIARGAATIREALTGDPNGSREAVAQAVHEARALARLDDRFEAFAERLAGLEAELDDASAEVRSLAEGVEHDPTALAAMEERLGRIYALERRYGDTEADVIAHGERASTELERLATLEDERARRQREDAALLAEVATTAEALSVVRSAAAGRLAVAVGILLEDLGFPPGVFEVAVGRRSAGTDEPAIELDGDAVAFDASGVVQVVYRLAPNPGEPARPLARIASGGELSRVALAIKTVLAEADATPVLVFDEVDTGIGGRSADPLGRSLWSLARRHQVLCVTHLPQIAAHADVHFRIAKRERDGRTITEIERLDHEGRIVELAAMLGGEAAGGPATLASARELLDRADAWRGEVARAS